MSHFDANDMKDNPYFLGSLLRLTDKWYKASPEITPLIQPFLDNYCYERMASLINKLQNRDYPSAASINIAELIKNGDLYWNHIKSHLLPEQENKE